VSGHDFESQIAALYRDPRPLADDAAFLAQVDANLERYLLRRRWVLTTLGILGGGITVSALVYLEADDMLRRFLASGLDLVAGVNAIPWAGVAVALIGLLALPALMRNVIDPSN
jgi:hypothetical protein